MLATTAEVPSPSKHPWLREVAESRRELATSISEAMGVSTAAFSNELAVAAVGQLTEITELHADGLPAQGTDSGIDGHASTLAESNE